MPSPGTVLYHRAVLTRMMDFDRQEANRLHDDLCLTIDTNWDEEPVGNLSDLLRAHAEACLTE